MNQNKHRESDSENYKKRLRRYLLRFAAPQHAVINNIRTFNPCKGVKPTKTQKQEKQVSVYGYAARRSFRLGVERH